MAARLQEIEYQWFSKQAVAAQLPANATLLDLKRAYYVSKLGADVGSHETISDLENKWLGHITGVTGKTYFDRWYQAVNTVTHGTVIAKDLNIDEIKTVFFTFAANGT